MKLSTRRNRERAYPFVGFKPISEVLAPGDTAVFDFDARIFNADRELRLKPTLLLPPPSQALRPNLVLIGSQFPSLRVMSRSLQRAFIRVPPPRNAGIRLLEKLAI